MSKREASPPATEEQQPPIKKTKMVDTTAFLQAKEAIQNLVQTKNCGPILVRLAWHDAGTYCKHSQTGGSHGTMQFPGNGDHGANAGLNIARELLQEIYEAHKGEVSLADLWQFAAVVAIEVMGGPKIPFRFGRTDLAEEDCTPDGRLPDATQKGDHLRDIFGRMGFTEKEIVTLSGAHTIGRCHADRSGFEGPWTDEPLVFDNTYFQYLLNKQWTVKEGSDPQQLEDETKELMMCPSDMALVEEDGFKATVEAYAADQDLFFADFAAAFQKLQELGHDDLQGPIEY
eukprot:TRINITY_DN10158_c0_g1_i1.p1 TRINITY_DN10158_c0_g1~~TRINITY_DN10158_c0_g1_i1.p1  ORF type:complete len:287 (-),score=91.55 TRINITY_DN10158_c0_g1_i1:47-907(-)